MGVWPVGSGYGKGLPRALRYPDQDCNLNLTEHTLHPNIHVLR